MVPALTTVLAVDQSHLRELRLVWPTWARHRPELTRWPLLIFCDADESISSWQSALSFIEHPDCRLISWSMDEVSQREKMLSAFVLGAAEHVQTPWYLKLDTDTVACSPDEWVRPEWFAPDDEGRDPVLIASPWGYTKPPNALQILDDWADTTPALAKHPRLNLLPSPGANALSHRRIISWCFFGNTSILQREAGLCAGRLPVPSQDTFLWYCAARRGELWRTVTMKKLGWDHISRYRRLREACQLACASNA